MHNNIRSLKHNLENLQTHLLHKLSFCFSVIGVSETRIRNANIFDFNPSLPNYNFEFVLTPLSAGGVGMYIDYTFNYKVLEKCSNESFQALWIEIILPKNANIICGVIYRQHDAPDRFLSYLDQTIEKFSALRKPVCLMGEININLLRYETSKFAQSLLLSLRSLNLIPTIDEPTRVHNNSATLIDNIFVNILEDDFVSGNTISDISDHYSQFCIFHWRKPATSWKNSRNVKPRIRDYSNFSDANFLEDLSQLDLDRLVTSKDDRNQSFSIFYSKVNTIVNKHAPLKRISNRRAKQSSKPCITKAIRKSIKIKNSLFQSGDRDKYKFYRNKVSMLISLSKKMDLHKYFEEHITNARKTWQGIHVLINRQKEKQKAISALKYPRSNKLLNAPTEIPNIFNNFFSSVGQSLSSKMAKPSTQCTSYLPRLSNPGSLFCPVTSKENEEEIMTIPSNKAFGFYSVPILFLRLASPIISYPLSFIINKSVETAIYPSKVKHAKVIPIFKNDDEIIPSNYRPISLLSVFNRIFEKLMYNRLKVYLEKQGVFYKSQNGFRDKHFTQHATLDIISQIQTNMDHELFSCGIFTRKTEALWCSRHCQRVVFIISDES